MRPPVWNRLPLENAATLSAARGRLIAAAQRYQRRKALTNEQYYGGDRAEETIGSIPRSRLVDAVVTRNHYGSLVLNAARTLFIDVDMLEPNGARGSVDERRDFEQSPWHVMLADLRTVLASETGEGFRIYRTAAGFRILATAHEFEPDSHDSKRLMETAGADAAFVDLCGIQHSFRARLTPKPWRCGTKRPPNFFPRERADQKRRFAEWLSQYERASRAHATCQYLGQVGRSDAHERIAPIIEFHDRETKAFEALPLA